MPYIFETGEYRKKEYTLVCQSDKCEKSFQSQWKFKKYCSPVCLQRGQYIKLKARQIAEGKNTRRIPANPGIKLGLTRDEWEEWRLLRRRETNRRNKARLNAECKADPQKGWAKRIWEKYKLTPLAYFTLKTAQGDTCALCSRETAHDDIKVLHVDHCHTTGKVRGLLCYNCNAMLGQARDSVEVLKRAIEYLEKNK